MAIYSGFSHRKMVIFHSYVKLPEGIRFIHYFHHENCQILSPHLSHLSVVIQLP